MSVNVLLPTAFNQLIKGDREIEFNESGLNIKLLIDLLEQKYPGIYQRFFPKPPEDAKADLELNKFINIYVGGEDIRHLQGLGTKLEDGVEVSIVPSQAGGTPEMPKGHL